MGKTLKKLWDDAKVTLPSIGAGEGVYLYLNQDFLYQQAVKVVFAVITAVCVGVAMFFVKRFLERMFPK